MKLQAVPAQHFGGPTEAASVGKNDGNGIVFHGSFAQCAPNSGNSGCEWEGSFATEQSDVIRKSSIR